VILLKALCQTLLFVHSKLRPATPTGSRQVGVKMSTIDGKPPQRRFREEPHRLGMTLEKASRAAFQYVPATETEDPEQAARNYFTQHATDADRKAGAISRKRR
jgi:hypothetical protein